MRWRVRNRRAESDREQWFCILGQSESIFRNMTSFSSRFRTRYIFRYITYWEFFPSFIPNFLSSHFISRGFVFGCPVFLFIPCAHLQKEIPLSTLFQVRKILSLNFRITVSSTNPYINFVPDNSVQNVKIKIKLVFKYNLLKTQKMKKRLNPKINYKKVPITTTYIQFSSPILRPTITLNFFMRVKHLSRTTR